MMQEQEKPSRCGPLAPYQPPSSLDIERRLTGRRLNRRHLITASLGIGIAARALLHPALAATGIDALDMAALEILHPDKALLIAVTMAGRRLVAVGEHGIIIYSDDNGASWRQGSVPVDVTLTCVAFSSPLVGWAAGHFGVILNSIDGGATWQLQLNGLQANQLTLAAAQAAVAHNEQSLPMPFALKRANIFIQDGADKPFLSMLALGGQKTLVFGAFRLAMLTTDAGKTWQDWSLHIADALSHNLYSATSVGSSIYLTSEAGLIFRSLDSGASFTQVAAPANITFFGLLGTADGSLIVYGVAGSCFRSDDNAKSWTPIDIPTQANLTAARLLRAGWILLTSEVGEIFLSRDNGQTFRPVIGLPPMAIFDLQEAPDASLVLVGGTGVARITPSALRIS